MRLEEFLSAHCQRRDYAAGELIFSGGQQAEAAYYIINGSVAVFKQEGEEKSVMAHLAQGDIFGEMALLRFDEYTLSAQATAQTALYEIIPELLHEQVRAAPPLVRALLDMLVERVHSTNEVLIDIDRAGRQSGS